MGPIRVVIVDSNRSFAEKVARLLLLQARREVSVVLLPEGDGGARSQAGNSECDIALVSLTMAPQSGYEALRRIRWDNPDIGIVAYGPFNDGSSLQRAIKAGADTYLCKLELWADLVPTIRWVVESHFAGNVRLGK